MLHLRSNVIALLAAAVFCAPAFASEARGYIDSALADEVEREVLVQEGKAAAFFCANCHGDDGSSRIPVVPNLAGQNPLYILDQIQAFLHGTRKDAFMEGLMKVLSQRDKAAIAMFYAEAKPLPASETPGPRAAEGAAYYVELCARCHQTDAYGAESYPRLAGQQVDYLQINLKRYLDMSGERIYPAMTGAVRQLGEKNIEAVAQYLSSLQ